MITIYGIEMSYDYIEPKQKCYPCFDDKGNLMPPEQPKYKCTKCGWVYTHIIYGSFELGKIPQTDQLMNILKFHQDNCKGKNNETKSSL